MKKLNMKMIIILIIAFFILVGILAAIAALASKGKDNKGNNNQGPTTQASEVPAVEPGNETNTTSNTTNSTPGGSVRLEGFDKYNDQVDLEIYFGSNDIESITEYSSAGTNMQEAKDNIPFDNLYVKELTKSEIKDLVKEFKKAFVQDNVTVLDLDDREVDELVASKLLVVNEEFYFGINETYAFSTNGSEVDIFEIDGTLSDFAKELPEHVDLGFGSFELHLDKEDIDITFDDRSEVQYIKDKFYSYETDIELDYFEKLGTINFDNDTSLELYSGEDIYAGTYKSGRNEKTVIINSDCMDALIRIVEQALGN